MATIIVGNQLAEETATGRDELPADYRGYLGMVSHRLLWLAQPGDVIVLPNQPDPTFVAYVWDLLGYHSNPPRIVVPPTGARDDLLLYDDRLLSEEFIDELRTLIRPSQSEIWAFFHDSTVMALAERLGLPTNPRRQFLEQGGLRLVNSKSTFRAIASGLALHIPEGIIATTPAAAERFIWTHLAESRSVIVKQDGHGGGYGNDILKSPAGPSGFGASRSAEIPDRQALAAEVRASWDRWTTEGTRPVVIEEYSGDAVPLYAEFDVRDGDAELVGHGEMRVGDSDDGPTNAGLVVPAVRAAQGPAYPAFLEEAQSLAAALGSIGYRGSVSVDSIALPDGRILLNEFNGRISGSTHVHTLCRALFHGDPLSTRVVLVRSHRTLPPTASTLDTLEDLQLRFDSATGFGVILGGDDGQLIIIASSLPDAEQVERLLDDAFAERGELCRDAV
ncbi:hypothetical protein [Curtobacterium sp. MCBD17_040]|uniref:preATP grasp domain-containing protein n=1 Tax=Curtobacterium sp. MCBD17_040 TaxID=2175674 RepID=UPI000DA83184|nr:hypothetical protein [Curtobacterium sp. MCBD17_040]WIB65847.1 hypothetical protein DEI94_17180 [Curtobacterium sp. MCBD17_040]